MNSYHSQHHSFLLRLWKDSEQGDWRVSMKDLITLETVHFSDLTSFVFFLKDKAEKHGAFPAGPSGKESLYQN